jgi:hypothetical protein
MKAALTQLHITMFMYLRVYFISQEGMNQNYTDSVHSVAFLQNLMPESRGTNENTNGRIRRFWPQNVCHANLDKFRRYLLLTSHNLFHLKAG